MLLCGCGQAELRQQVRTTQAELQDTRRQLGETQAEVAQLKDIVLRGFDNLYSRMDCSDQRIKEFLAECEKGSDQCSPQAVQNLMVFMENQSPAFCMLRGDTRMQSLLPIREGALMQLADPKNFRPTTRFLVLVQPRAETAEAYREAKLVGQDVVDYMRKTLAIPSKIRIMGPMTLPCKSKQEELNKYISKIARPLPNEASDKAYRVKVFTYRTEC
jgi:hypothetical protein